MIGKNVKKRLRFQTRTDTCGRTNTIKKRYVWIEYFLTREKLCNSKIKRVRWIGLPFSRSCCKTVRKNATFSNTFARVDILKTLWTIGSTVRKFALSNENTYLWTDKYDRHSLVKLGFLVHKLHAFTFHIQICNHITTAGLFFSSCYSGRKAARVKFWVAFANSSLNACKSLRFSTMPVITTRFGRKRGTLECGLHDVACVANVIGEGEGRAPNSLIFSCFPRSPSLSPMYSTSHCSFETKWRRLCRSVRGGLPLAQRGFCSR